MVSNRVSGVWERHPQLAVHTGVLSGFLAVGLFVCGPSLSVLGAPAPPDGVFLASSVVVPKISTALDHVREDREQVVAERDAFDHFIQYLAATDPPAHSLATNDNIETVVGGARLITRNAPSEHGSDSVSDPTPLVEVRNVYRSAIMGVPHYEEEYGDSFAEDVAAEFGPELARALVEADRLTEKLKAALLEQSRRSKRERTRLLTQVEDERDALVTARRSLRELHETATTIEADLYPRPLRGLVQSWERLDALETDCETLLQKRQREIQTRTGALSSETIQAYLYRSYPWRYPILDDSLSILARIRSAKRQACKAVYTY